MVHCLVADKLEDVIVKIVQAEVNILQLIDMLLAHLIQRDHVTYWHIYVCIAVLLNLFWNGKSWIVAFVDLVKICDTDTDQKFNMAATDDAFF